jgi:hypothetical protein
MVGSYSGSLTTRFRFSVYSFLPVMSKSVMLSLWIYTLVGKHLRCNIVILPEVEGRRERELARTFDK